MERQIFLAQVELSARRATLPDPPSADPGLLVPDLDEVDLADLFTRQLEDVDGVVHRTRPEEVAETVVRIARQHQVHSFLCWDERWLPVPGVGERLRAEGLEQVDGEVPAEGRLEHQSRYVDLLLGVTGADAGLAESGSVVLRSGPGRPRMASLIPLVHVALLATDRLSRSLAHWAAAEGAMAADVANLIVITGPSRTGDIEQQLNLGVHGPREVHVVLIDTT